MSYSVTKWSSQRVLDPQGFDRDLRAVLLEYNGNLSHAADAMGVGRRSLRRWVHDSPLSDLARKLRDKHAKKLATERDRKAARAA